ncbi:hypothetical protein NDU88_007168 [Pleurodeles waltl]|uniref:Uncharacterized protein n=1 Tax=Pleurodeles waltl TaxID=8319 RepID=A0AAV7WCP8_PLEWA|nr:hypothetical protein NDU88_007168 [Pleurodeles waltl]
MAAWPAGGQGLNMTTCMVQDRACNAPTGTNLRAHLCYRRRSYRTGQDIENCGTCRDCACIIYRCVTTEVMSGTHRSALSPRRCAQTREEERGEAQETLTERNTQRRETASLMGERHLAQGD